MIKMKKKFLGVIPFFIYFFFKHMIDNKIVSLTEIQRLVRDYNYGHLDKRNIPSLVKINHKNKKIIGQNASQIYCLMTNLPFIFWEFKHMLNELWKTMECLLSIMQIVYSTQIDENEIKLLEDLIKQHLSDLVNKHNLKLIFKHHQIIHYPNVIRKTGPVIHGWMMRYEAKHKQFTGHAHILNNHINISKSLAYHHQQRIFEKNPFKMNMKPSKINEKFVNDDNFDKYKHHFDDHDVNSIIVLQFLYFHYYEYRKGLMLLNDRNVYGII